MFFFGRRVSSNSFRSATIAMTCRQSAGPFLRMGSIADVLHFNNSVFSKTRYHFLFENEMPPLPERLERALVSNTWAIPAILTTLDIAPPAEKSIQESSESEIRCWCSTGSTPICRQYLTESHRLASGITSGSGIYLFQYTRVSSSLSWVPSLYRFCRSWETSKLSASAR
jgi:hypothetical protein